jgi:superoxide dismutase
MESEEDTWSYTQVKYVKYLHNALKQLLSHHNFSLFTLVTVPLLYTPKLANYHVSRFSSISGFSPIVVTLFLFFAPFIVILSVFVVFKILLWLLKIIFPYFWKKLHDTPQPNVYLQVTVPSDTNKSAYATQQLYLLLHRVARNKGILARLKRQKKSLSLEIVASKEKGIRYIVVVPKDIAEIIKSNLLSFLPGIEIREVSDYLNDSKFITHFEEQKKSLILTVPSNIAIEELKFSDHFALPLKAQKMLTENDPAAYLTGNMTQLKDHELIAYQMVVSPVLPTTQKDDTNTIQRLKQKIANGQPLHPELSEDFLEKLTEVSGVSWMWMLIRAEYMIGKLALRIIFSIFAAFFDIKGVTVPVNPSSTLLQQESFDPYEKELQLVVKDKLDSHLYEFAMRLLVVSSEPDNRNRRMLGLLYSFEQLTSSYQSLTVKGSFFPEMMTVKSRLKNFRNRLLATGSPFNKNPIISNSEIADLYHFPYLDTTKTENVAKVMSPELPLPLLVKNMKEFDISFAQNTYAGIVAPVGLTDEERSRHMYIVGQTGSGKSTILFHSAKDDIQKGRGICVIDPHGDLVEDLLTVIPENRINDIVYFDPDDISYPVRINLLELTPGLSPDEEALEKEIVVESVISIFRRIFLSNSNANAHRIEYILRNTIYTAFYVQDQTIFTVNKLLLDEEYRKKVLKNVTDENILSFWKNEFSKAGDWQVFKMISGVTSKVGRFQFSPIASRILEEPHSSINFDTLLDQNKIILCNFSEGKLGEDTSQLLGTTVIAKIHLSMLKRARRNIAFRDPFYLYVDEFQNFATSHFTKLLSGGRKYGLRVTVAQQSTTQQSDRNIINVLLANIGTIVCFRTASPVDEELLLPQFIPQVGKGDILNLPRYHFYMKLGSVDPQEPFSGITYPIHVARNTDWVEQVIAASRKNYATIYTQPEKDLVTFPKVKILSHPATRRITYPNRYRK